MVSRKPTVLFVHGSWHSPAHFQPVMELFEAHGYPTECPCQPSFNAKPASTNLDEDVKVIRCALDKLVVDEIKDVVVVMHSYGGVVGTQAVDESLGKRARQNKGLAGGVVHLLYLSAFILQLGDSLRSVLGQDLPPFVKVEVRQLFLASPFKSYLFQVLTKLIFSNFQLQEDGTCNMMEPERRFYNDLPQQQQQRWVSELKPHPVVTQLTPISYAAYMHYPVTYLYCENDQALPLKVQKMMVARSGLHFETETCASGHSPFLSMPETVLKVVEKIGM
ncbi:hypothetical protein MMC15_004544 [Xylographa vitiligo]|nr:hypothetical protein [Xylographa vitiligo]